MPDANPPTPKDSVSQKRPTICEEMNPDKLFDYLEGRLSPTERAALEEQLMSDKQLQREFAVARQIHAGMRGDSQEVVLPAPRDVPEQGGPDHLARLVDHHHGCKRRHRSMVHLQT